MGSKLKRINTKIVFLLIFLGCANSSNWIDTLPKPWELNEQQVSDILPQFHKKFPDFHDRLKAFALWQVGKPYELFCLGEESGEDKQKFHKQLENAYKEVKRRTPHTQNL